MNTLHIVNAFTDKPFAGNPAAVCVLDQPVTALIRDLKQRGLLEDTLVVWCTEFGRMPFSQKEPKAATIIPTASPAGSPALA